MHQIDNIPVRFFIYDTEVETTDPWFWEGDIRECTEAELKEALASGDYVLEYVRHTVRENGVNQICLTAMPYS